MNYENSKRLVGVKRETFSQMLQILNLAYEQTHKRGGCTPKLSLEDLLMATLQYLREYRIDEQIAADFGIHESNLIRRSKWVEGILIKNSFQIAGRDIAPEDTILVDATEIRVCRPEKNST